MTGITVKSNKSGKKLDTAEDVSEVIEQINDNEDQVETIKLDGNSYGVEPLKEIGNSLQTCHNLQHLLLNDMFISRLKNEIPEALRYLLGGVQQSNAQIITLNLNDNAIGPVTMPDLLPFLRSKQCSSLKNLYLNNCGLGIKGGTMLAGVLSNLENLTELVIGRNRLEVDGIFEISESLSKLNNLERLEIPQNGTKDKAIVSICQALTNNTKLKILNMNDNVLTSTAEQLAGALKNLKNLEILNLGDCLLKTKGTMIILAALKSQIKENGSSRIEEINLSGNEIGKEAKLIILSTIEAILEARPDSSKKLKIDLSSNNLGQETVDYLKNHFCSNVDLFIEEDQGSDDEDDPDRDNSVELNQSNGGDYLDSSENLIDDPEKLQSHLELKYKDLDSLCKRFFQISTKGFQPSDANLDEKALKEITALIKVGKKNFIENETDFSLLNSLLVVCGLMKAEDKSKSPRKETDLSGPLIALAAIVKEFNSNPIQKRCIAKLLLEKIKEDRYKHLQININSLIYSF